VAIDHVQVDDNHLERENICVRYMFKSGRQPLMFFLSSDNEVTVGNLTVGRLTVGKLTPIEWDLLERSEKI
jgi:hypothetical protein